MHRGGKIVGVDRRLKRHIERIGLRNRIIHIIIGIDADDRAEDLIARDCRIGRWIEQHGGRVSGV